MCTVTYIPLPSGSFILTHNRDEKMARLTAAEPVTGYFGHHELTYPKDPQGQGTWIATSSERVVCLLNGAYIPFEPEESYRHSRGLVVLDVFRYDNEEAFAKEYDFFGLAPFTLILAAQGSLHEMRWTGTQLHKTVLRATLPAIWSSSTLYTPAMQRTREGWLANWLRKNPTSSPMSIMKFHEEAGDGDPTINLVMQRGDVYRTVSITQVVYHNQTAKMHYKDLSQEHCYQTLVAPTHATL
jgi:uncharacterized protein with NRDE domain